MAAVFNPSLMMTCDFFQENSSEDLGPSSREIEQVLGIELESGVANFLDSISSKEAYDLLCEILAEEKF